MEPWQVQPLQAWVNPEVMEMKESSTLPQIPRPGASPSDTVRYHTQESCFWSKVGGGSYSSVEKNLSIF